MPKLPFFRTETKTKIKTGSIVVVNCAAIPRELMESEFFGHEKGSFTGAYGRKIGILP